MRIVYTRVRTLGFIYMRTYVRTRIVYVRTRIVYVRPRIVYVRPRALALHACFDHANMRVLIM